MLKQLKRLALWSVILLVSAGALYLACHKVDGHELLRDLRKAHGWYLAAGCAVATLSYLVRGVRWRILLSAERKLKFSTVFWASLVGYLGNSYLPARAGEVMRSVMLGQQAGISAGYVLATALTERILDAVVLVGICLVAVWSMAGLPPWFLPAALLLGATALVALVVLYVGLRYRHLFLALLRRLPLPAAFHTRAATLLDQFALGARAIHHRERAIQFAALTLVIWTLDGVSTIIGAHALELTLTFPQALLLLAALGISSTIPSTPGALGIFQLVAETILMPFGFSRSAALAYILVSQACSYLVVTCWGGLGLLIYGRDRRQSVIAVSPNAELDRRYQHYEANPGNLLSLEELQARVQNRK